MALGACSAHAADEWWGYDKGEHLVVTTGVAAVFSQGSRFFVASPFVRAGIGFGAAVVIGAGKELVDLAGFGDPSWKDFTWDVIGAAVGTVLSFAFEWVLDRVFTGSEA